MKRHLIRTVCLAALLCSAAPAQMPPAFAQSFEISFDAFHDQLASYGDWVYSDRWGEVWIPDVPPDFQPYATDGYWADTEDYGWTWVSTYEWGDIPFHYGRWVNDPDDGWLWIPGYIWSPAWVVWRSNADVIGWMPMPPDRQFLSGGFDVSSGGVSFSINFNNFDSGYGYSQWYGPSYDLDRFAGNWVFVDAAHVGDRDFRRYRQPRANYRTFIRNTTNITNYTVINNIVVNRSVTASAVQRAGGRPPPPVRASTVLRKPQFVARVDQGRRAQEAVRAQIPRGTGAAGSAPQPDATAVSGLSDKLPQRGGPAPKHVFTRDTVRNAPAVAGGAPKDASPAAAPRAATQGPPETGRSNTAPPDATPTPQQRPADRDDRQDRRREDQQRQEQQREVQQRERQERQQQQQRQDQARQDQERAARDQRQQQQEEQQRQVRQRQQQERQEQDQRQRQDQQQRQQQERQQQERQQQQEQQRQVQQRQQQERQEQDQRQRQEQQQRQQQERQQQERQQQQEQQRQVQQRQQQERQEAGQRQRQEQQQRQQQERQQPHEPPKAKPGDEKKKDEPPA